MNLQEITAKSEASILAVKEALGLLLMTYGEGCSDSGTHPDAEEIRKAARTLIVHLSWLKARAVTLSLMAEVSEDTKNKFGGLVR